MTYPSKDAVDVLCPPGLSFCGKPCAGRDTCPAINPQYDPDWREREPAEDFSCFTDDEWAAIMAGFD
jgi:hypothetical protein